MFMERVLRIPLPLIYMVVMLVNYLVQLNVALPLSLP